MLISSLLDNQIARLLDSITPSPLPPLPLPVLLILHLANVGVSLQDWGDRHRPRHLSADEHFRAITYLRLKFCLTPLIELAFKVHNFSKICVFVWLSKIGGIDTDRDTFLRTNFYFIYLFTRKVRMKSYKSELCSHYQESSDRW